MNKPNIFFLLIDSFRADKFYGKEKTSVTPNLDSLIQNGVYFTQTINSSPASTSAIASVLTGKWPHKVITNGETHHELSHNEPNFINHLNKLGYNTIALTPEYFNYAKLTTDFKESLQFNGGLHDGVGQKIIDILEKLESPWFFFIHILDIHGTARNFPKQYDNQKFGFNGYERRISAMDPWFGKIFNKIDKDKTLSILTADHSTDRGIYSLEQEEMKKNLNQNNLKPFVGVANKILSKTLTKKLRGFYIDKKIKTKNKKRNNALKNISKLSPYEKRVQNNLVNPGFSLFDDRFRIPLLFSGLGMEPKIIDNQIRSVDIFPTIFDIIDTASDTTLDGTSVLPLIKGKFFEEKPALMQIITNWLETKSKSNVNLIGVRFNGFKYFRSINNSNENVHLFDLKIDPYEEYNLAQKKPKKVFEMEKILLQIFNDDKILNKKLNDVQNLHENKKISKS